MHTRSRFPLPRIIALALVILPLGPALAATAPGAVSSGPEAPELCRLASQRVERAERIPAGLLRAIGRVESGRWVKAVGASVAWPWTVYAGSSISAPVSNRLREKSSINGCGRSFAIV